MDEKGGYIPVDQRQQQQPVPPYPTAPDITMSSGGEPQPPPYPVTDQPVVSGQGDFSPYLNQPPQIPAQQQPEAYHNQYPPYGAPPPGPAYHSEPKPPAPISGYPNQSYPQQSAGPPPPAPAQVPPAVVVPNISTPFLGHKSTTVRCQFCAATVTTETEYSVGSGTWLSCLAVFGIGVLCTLFIGIGCILFFLCWVPCVIDECKDVTHYCPNCRKVICQRGALVLGR